jgi:DNA-binding protein HU-beta
MNKKQLLDAYAEKMDITKKESDRLITGLFELIEDTVASGKSIKIIGHGTWELKDVSARDGVSKLGGVPQQWHTDACKKPSFSPGSAFKNKCNL